MKIKFVSFSIIFSLVNFSCIKTELPTKNSNSNSLIESRINSDTNDEDIKKKVDEINLTPKQKTEVLNNVQVNINNSFNQSIVSTAVPNITPVPSITLISPVPIQTLSPKPVLTPNPMTTIIPPNPPTGIEINNISLDSFNVFWNKVDGATSYIVYKDGVKYSETIEPSIFITELKDLNKYTIEISSLKSGIESNKSKQIIATTKPYLPGKIIFVSSSNNSSELYIMNADGTEQKKIMKGSFCSLSYIKSSSKILYSECSGSANNVKTVDLDGKNPTILFIGSNAKVSNDGNKIVYISYDSPNYEVYIKDLINGSVKKIPITGQSKSNPSWSPDDSKIVYFNQGITLMDIDGTNQLKLNSDTFQDHSSFSPDGSKIIFDGVNIINSDGKNKQMLDNGLYPSFSPDGSKIVYSKFIAGSGSIMNNTYELYVMDITTRNTYQLTNNTVTERYPIWID